MNTERFRNVYSLTKSSMSELRREFDATFPEKVEDVLNDSTFSMRILCSVLLEHQELLHGNERKFLLLAESVANYSRKFRKEENFCGAFVLREDIFDVLSSKAMERYLRLTVSKDLEMIVAKTWRALIRSSFTGLTICEYSLKYFKVTVPKWNKKYPFAVRIVYETMLAESQGKNLSLEKMNLLELYKELSAK